MQKIDPNLNLSCTLLPGRFLSSQPVPRLYNEVYSHWKDTWTEVFNNVNSPESLNVENFLRQSVVIALCSDKNLVGIATLTFFNLSAPSTFDHPFFKPFSEECLRKYKGSEEGLVLSSEYLSIDKNFRKQNGGFSFKEIIVGLVMKVFSVSDAKAILGTSVEKTKTHETCMNYGYTKVGSCKKFNLECLLLENTKTTLKNHPLNLVQDIIESCWSDKADYTNQSFDINHELKSAA